AGWGAYPPRHDPTPARHSASISAVTRVYDALWTRVNVLMTRRPSPFGGGITRGIMFALCLSAAFALPAHPQDYPSQKITIIAPYAAGGSIDLIARLIAEGLSVRLKQSVIVENKSGGNGVIGIREAIKALPDGTTL